MQRASCRNQSGKRARVYVGCGLRPAGWLARWLRGVDKRVQSEKRGWGREEEKEEVEMGGRLAGEGGENPEFEAQVSSAVLRYFYRQTRRFNRDSRYFIRARARERDV